MAAEQAVAMEPWAQVAELLVAMDGAGAEAAGKSLVKDVAVAVVAGVATAREKEILACVRRRSGICRRLRQKFCTKDR